MKGARLVADLRRFSKIALDSSVLIYHLEDAEPYSSLTEIALGAVAEGAPAAVLSTISVTELLVKPFADGREDRVAVFEKFVLSLPNAAIVPPGYRAAREAARLRARYDLRTPDALLLATAIDEKAEAFLTNDGRLRRLKPEGLTVLVLDDYL
jgi:predicted nucleic acid-binding protein